MNNSSTQPPSEDHPPNALNYNGRVLRFYRSHSVPCPYRDESAEFLVAPSKDRDTIPYHFYMLHNFRRDGEQLIRPDCPKCWACQAYRVLVDEFVLKRRHRRNLKTNHDLSYQLEPMTRIDNYRALFDAYQAHRHPESKTRDPEDSLQDFGADFAHSLLGVARRGEEVLAVMVIDHSGPSFSAVYTFYDPEQMHRGLGIYMILQLIEQAKEVSYPYVYLGYYVADCDKLNYKARFQPSERFYPPLNQWIRIPEP